MNIRRTGADGQDAAQWLSLSCHTQQPLTASVSFIIIIVTYLLKMNIKVDSSSASEQDKKHTVL